MQEVLGQIFGFAGGIIMIATGLPQTLRIRKLGNTDGLALSPWILMLFTFSAYAAYGLMQDSVAIWSTNALTFLTTAMVVTAFKGNSIRNWLFILAGGLAWGFLITLMPTILASIILAALTANRVPQLILSWINRHTAMVTAVSIPSLLITMASVLCWLIYAFLERDYFIVFTSFLAIGITLITALVENHIANLAKKAHLG
jgi:uncharacterized protein with PQ loop repeat